MHSTRSRADVFALAYIAFAFVALLAPALAATNAQSDKQLCMSRMRDVAIALLNHHDTFNYFPLASSEPLDHQPGTTDGRTGGYSWLVRVLPFGESAIYNQINLSTDKLRIPPFDPAVTVKAEKTTRSAASIPISTFVCPSFVGGPTIGDDAPEYAAYTGESRPAITSYHATTGSHFENTQGVGRMLPPDQVANVPKEGGGIAVVPDPREGNGIIVFPDKFGEKVTTKGIGLRGIPDGTSNTFLFAESNERNYAAWIDGQTTWLVSAWPSNPDVPTMQMPTPGQSVLAWTTEQLKNNQVTPGAQKGVEAKDEPTVYLPEGRWTGKAKRTWGASSNHPEGIGHAFADGHAPMISRDIDPVVYLHLTTRAGGEAIAAEDRP